MHYGIYPTNVQLDRINTDGMLLRQISAPQVKSASNSSMYVRHREYETHAEFPSYASRYGRANFLHTENRHRRNRCTIGRLPSDHPVVD